ncbi:MAG: restriction endonuclease [Firmicutes bacterium]|nr:restriction endonuclease [Bacillota bacterium]MBV1727036.1 restriction endonuclease [Desulforudis sp.]MBV1734530.1 restriction endonuclease [Desulforudis sp.]
MTIPDYETIMLPLLKLAGDGKEHTKGAVIEELARHFSLTEDEQKELLPSGNQAKFTNRVGWARTYLTKAVLLETTGRARFRITKRGLQVLGQNPAVINNDFLNRFPEFVQFRSRSQKSVKQESADSIQTPEETLEASYQGLRGQLVQELLERMKGCTPSFFESLVVDLLVAMGYGGSRKDAGQAIGRTRDGGIDGIIKEDRLGLDVVYVQAKRWEGTVGRPTVQAFSGSLDGQKARKGVLITTSQFSPDAVDYVGRIEKKIVLIDGEQLCQLMIDHSVGVTEVARYVVKKIDSDYFGDE